MIPYWILFGIPAIASMVERSGRMAAARAAPPLIAALFFVTLLIGFRYQVGGDWGAYLNALLEARLLKFDSIPGSSDPGYVLVNWLVAQMDGDIWVTNLICGILFCWGLYRFIVRLRRPWLALAVAVPYLVIVVAMGYTRQAVAIGLAMHALVALTERSNFRFVFWIVLAATFHKSAVLLIPIAALTESRGRLWTVLWIGAAGVASYYTLLESSVDSMVSGYVDAEMGSSGAAIRAAMSVLPAALFLFFRSRFDLPDHEKRLWTILSLLAVALIPILLVSPSSTAVDRMALYLIPLQLVVLSLAPDSLSRSHAMAQFLSVLIVIYCAGIQVVWLNYADNAGYWVPYSLFPI